MNFYETKTMRECEMKPTQVEMNRLADERELLSVKEKADFTRSKMGEIGENRVCDFIKTEARPGWTLIRNMWLSDDGPFECDIILITNHAVHTFEVKHYTGRFTYENSSCKIGNIKMAHDCIQQARKSFLKLQKICKKFNYHMPVNGSIVFSSPKNKVVINSTVEDIRVLEIPGLYEYLQDIKRDEDMHPQAPINTQILLEFLESYEIENLYQSFPYSAEQLATARKGICCGMCRSFNIEHSKHYVHCKCGFHESREEAIVRSACEYGALTYDRNFSTGDIWDFIDKQASKVFTQKVLATHFNLIQKNKHSNYENYGRDYLVVTDKFTFNKNAYYYNKRNSLYKHILINN